MERTVASDTATLGRVNYKQQDSYKEQRGNFTIRKPFKQFLVSVQLDLVGLSTHDLVVTHNSAMARYASFQ